MNLEAPGGHIVSSLTCAALQGSQRCLYGSMGTAGQSSISWKAPCCVLCLLPWTRLAGPGVLQGCHIYPGDALTCGISPDTAAPKPFLYPQFRKGWGIHFPCKKARDLFGEQGPQPATVVPMLRVSSAGDTPTTPLLPKAGIQLEGIFQISVYRALCLARG